MRRFLVELAPTSTGGVAYFCCIAATAERAAELAAARHPGRAVLGVTEGDPPTAAPPPPDDSGGAA
jgi:hypothetical protein